MLLQVPLLVGPEDAVHEWEALWVTVLAARDALVPLVAPYLACTGDPEGARDMVQNVSAVASLILTADAGCGVSWSTSMNKSSFCTHLKSRGA